VRGAAAPADRASPGRRLAASPAPLQAPPPTRPHLAWFPRRLDFGTQTDGREVTVPERAALHLVNLWASFAPCVKAGRIRQAPRRA
jgi:hypothetical protein